MRIPLYNSTIEAFFRTGSISGLVAAPRRSRQIYLCFQELHKNFHQPRYKSGNSKFLMRDRNCLSSKQRPNYCCFYFRQVCQGHYAISSWLRARIKKKKKKVSVKICSVFRNIWVMKDTQVAVCEKYINIKDCCPFWEKKNNVDFGHELEWTWGDTRG